MYQIPTHSDYDRLSRRIVYRRKTRVERRLQLGYSAHHCGVLESLETFGVVQVDTARVERHPFARRFGLDYRFRVAREDDVGDALLTRLGVDVGDQRIGNADDEFCHSVAAGRLQNNRVGFNQSSFFSGFDDGYTDAVLNAVGGIIKFEFGDDLGLAALG